MSYAVGEHFDKFIRAQVKAGRYNNASEVVREGLRLVEEREAKLNALRIHIEDALERGGYNTEDDLETALMADRDARRKQR